MLIRFWDSYVLIVLHQPDLLDFFTPESTHFAQTWATHAQDNSPGMCCCLGSLKSVLGLCDSFEHRLSCICECCWGLEVNAVSARSGFCTSHYSHPSLAITRALHVRLSRSSSSNLDTAFLMAAQLRTPQPGLHRTDWLAGSVEDGAVAVKEISATLVIVYPFLLMLTSLRPIIAQKHPSLCNCKALHPLHSVALLAMSKHTYCEFL